MSSRVLSFALFLSVVLSLLAAIHFYLWARLVRDTQLPVGAASALTALFVLLFFSVPLTFWFGRHGARNKLRPVLLLSYGWLGVLFLLLVLVAGSDLGRAAALVLRRYALHLPALDAAARLTVTRQRALAVGFTGVLLTLSAVRSATGQVRVREVEVGLPRLPQALDGFQIVQLSDVHVGPTIGREFVERMVGTVAALKPDLVAITGDLVDGSVQELSDAVEPLKTMKAPSGVYFVTGNHEYYSGASAWCRKLEALGVRVLRNERVAITKNGASFDLAGIDDYSARGNGHGADLPRAIAGRDPDRELVLLAHQPRAVYEAANSGVGLLLSGHTHGGQLWPWNYLVRLQQPFVSGLSKFGDTQVYVSNGTGYWGPPMRLGAPAEITRITLRATRTPSSAALTMPPA